MLSIAMTNLLTKKVATISGIVFTAAFKVVDWTTPGDLRKQIAEGNVALAVYAGSLAIAIAIIIGHLLS